MLEKDELLKLENQLCFAVYSANLSFNQKYRKLLKPLGLTYSQYLVMLVLWEKKHAMVSDIGKRLFLESSTLTPMLKRLEGLGLIERKRSVQDERQVIITLTEQGKDLRVLAETIPEKIQCESEYTLQTILDIKHQLNDLRDRLNQSG
ncbi:MarR family winged helix-turn-helix transcriptional regulator [Acinetobacter rathckeae]|uniref:MarR family winged helix-turn-helix transcriptional regulator n=1 Tax=Acinetobacter rathckeae TaxID=2605272 RepID=UPI0018A27D44|nr:MarR family transcriptional regulator [Acinetobacter rathckeae]MBF7686926.1 MarR family transcriptional regulator [Acinetobacter rathckeae]MBF7694670.1 MarR family transcriptional regulator [Acinetobacter rathckeae]